MEVTRIEPVRGNSRKYHIFLNDAYAFDLYKGEIRRHRLETGQELEEDEYRRVLADTLLKRGKNRAIHLLEKMDRTEGQLRKKLREGGYPTDVIDEIVIYVKSYHYIDDERYVQSYIRAKERTKSRRQIEAELRNKGVAPQIIQIVYEQYDAADEADTIRMWMEKKHYDPHSADDKEKRRFYQFLLRRGFSYEDIRRAESAE